MSIEKIKMKLHEKSYDIQIGSGFLKHFDFRSFKGSKYIIIADSNTHKFFGKNLVKNISSQKLPVELLEIPAGENSKNLRVVENLTRELAKRGVDKKAIIIALGGGVVGDIGGFVASVYERGIRYIQIPTTLLAQVDSSIGGKTGVNIPEGKNLIGRIYQPLAVIVDVETLKNLDDSQIRNGLAEVIKYAVINDEKFFRYLEKRIQDRSSNFYLEIIRKAVTIKTSVVSKDENEEEFRKILNYGHTVGHAIEILSNHKIPHGEAIAYGMIYEGKIAQRLGLWNKSALERQNNLVDKLGFSIKLNFKAEKLIEIMSRDKKSIGGRLYFVLPEKIGKIYQEGKRVSIPVDAKIVLDCFGDSD